MKDFDYRNPDYAAVLQERMRRLTFIREHPDEVATLKAFYATQPWTFISDWGVTYDPRNAERGLITRIPFVLFPKQIEWCQWILECWRDQQPGLCEKSRDMGISWLSTALACTLCIFNDGLAIGFGSRKEEYVDKIGTIKPLLPKGRMFMENLPQEFRAGYRPWQDSPFMRMNFPDTGSIIMGEAGDQIGRGDRASIYFVDEAQPLDARLMTPGGYRLMADMQAGAEVLGQDGRPQKVTHINDCGVHDVFRVTFSDGTSAECSPNHLWTVSKVWGGREQLTLRTWEIAETHRYESPGGQVQYRYRVPVCEPVQFARKNSALPLDPYLVGALLGDGGLTGGAVKITTADQEIVESFRALLPTGVVVGAFDGRYTYGIGDEIGCTGRYSRSRARMAAISAGIYGVHGPDKSVPDAYKFSTPENRLSLLQGLMDTDGSATAGNASFYSSSLQLAEDVRFLAQSLGGSATINCKPDRRGYRDIYAVHVALPAGMAPFRLSRKLAKLRPRKHPPHRTIVAVEHVGRRPVRCITVENADGLYLTDNFIVTHNSAHLERPDLVEMSLSQTTNCRIDMSSVNGMNNPFAQKRHSGKVDVFIFDWRDDPRKDQAWYDKQCQDLDPVVVAQEIDRDYSASVSGIVIPGAWVRTAIDAREKLGLPASGQMGFALDIADEGIDKNSIVGGQGIDITTAEEWSGKGSDTFQTVETAFNMIEERGCWKLRYDADGMGALVRGDGRILNERRRANGAIPITIEAFRGSDKVFDPEGIVEGTIGVEGRGRTNQDYYANRKAQGWWALRKRFQKVYRWINDGVPCNPDDIISISSKMPRYQKLVAELSQPTYKQNPVGKMLIDKKPDGMKSPNLADGCMMRFAPNEPPPLEVTADILAAVRQQGAMNRAGRNSRRFR